VCAYIQVKQIIEEENVGLNLVLGIDCWLDAGRSEYKLAANCQESGCL